MRISLPFLLFLGSAALAREVPKTPDYAPQDVLVEWAKAQSAVRQSHRIARVTVRDQVAGTVEKSSLELWYRKPDLFRFDDRDDKGRLKESVYCFGRDAHIVFNDTEVIYHLSEAFGFPEKPERYPETFRGSICGVVLERLSLLADNLPVQRLRERYDVRRIHRDAHWIYLQIRPRSAKDREEFRLMEIVLAPKDFRVRRLFIRQPGAIDVVYDFDSPEYKTAVTPESISKGLPFGSKRHEWTEKDLTPE
jgi:hypothetical protein